MPTSSGAHTAMGTPKPVMPWRKEAKTQPIAMTGRPRHRALSSSVISATEDFASPKSIDVLASKYSSFSMPANPGFIERLSTMTDLAWSTLRIGIP